MFRWGLLTAGLWVWLFTGCIGPLQGNGPNLPGGAAGSNSPQPSQSVTFIFAATQTGVSVFKLDSAGNISPAGTGLSLSNPAIATTQHDLVVFSNEHNGQLISYAVAANGDLTQQSSTPLVQPVGSIASDSRFVYLFGLQGIFGFDGQGGKLQPLAGSPYNATPDHCDLCSPSSIAVTPSKVFSSEQTSRDASSLTSFSRASDGILGQGVETAGASQDSLQIAATPDARFVYVTTDVGEVIYYSVQVDGSLIFRGGLVDNSFGIPNNIVVSNDGAYLLVSTSGSLASIRVFHIDSGSGATQEIANSPFLIGETPNPAMAMDSGGHFVVVAGGQGLNSNMLMVFAFDPASGELRKASSANLNANVTQVAIGTFEISH
jgi:6-phosphogluconolactonase (cycloisomerase 2 family)